VNASASDIDMSSYDFAKGCTGCHPGGASTEYDRDGYRYDERVENGPAWPEFDGDYHANQWAQSGVIEADCLLCHMSSYRTAMRTPQLKAGNFRVAPVAGSFMGTPRDNEVVDYDVDFQLLIETQPTDRSCSQCHAGTATELFNASGVLKSDIAKRGRSWDDPNNYDAHDRILDCVDCHHAGSRAGDTFQAHNVQKGNIKVGSAVRDDLDNALGFRNCSGCHSEGADVSDLPVTPPVPAHEGLPLLHFDRIHCVTCHIPKKDLFAVNSFDFLEGTKVPFFIGGSPKNPYGGGIKPAYLWWHEETEAPFTWKLYPFNYLTSLIWNRGDEETYAIHLKKIKPVYDQLVAQGLLTDDIPDSKGGLAEPNRTEEIEAFRAALLAAGLQDPKIRLSAEPFQLSHNISMSKDAIGSGGCSDCHRKGSEFFNREVQFVSWSFEDLTHVSMEIHIYDDNGVEQTIEGYNTSLPRWRLMGYSEQRKNELEALLDD
jgi:hypothetical protein